MLSEVVIRNGREAALVDIYTYMRSTSSILLPSLNLGDGALA